MAAKTIYFQDESVYREATFYAKKLNTNISRLVEMYLKNLVRKKKQKKKYLSDSIAGILGQKPTNFDYEESLLKILKEKYK